MTTTIIVRNRISGKEYEFQAIHKGLGIVEYFYNRDGVLASISPEVWKKAKSAEERGYDVFIYD